MDRKFDYDGIPTVQTTKGFIKGYKYEGIHIFKGIEYAKAERFQRATELEPWEGVKETTSYGYVAPLMSQDEPTGELLVPHMYWPQHEDCLSLNIWSKEIGKKNKKPVMVWLHGGGYFAGSSIEQLAYDGANMADEGEVVVVSLNHRLNILGFLDLSPFDEKYQDSGNLGLADIVDALKWIQENIAAFGGDPENITLFGQSGGGMKISALMQIPEAEGLFHKGIMMSGIAGDFMEPSSVGDGTEIVTAMLEYLNIPLKEVEKLEKIPYAQLVEAYNASAPNIEKNGSYVGNNPMIDDFFLGEAHRTKWTEQAKNTPLMIGSVFGEFSTFTPSKYDKQTINEKEAIEILTDKFGEGALDIIEEFKIAYPDKHLLDVLELDMIFRPLILKFLESKAKYNEAPTYSYMFSLDFPINGGQNAWHCSDIPFAFNNTDKVPVANIEGVSDRVEAQMFNAFVTFAHSGDPNHEGIPTWKPTTKEMESTLILDRETRVGSNFDHKLIQNLKKMMPKITLESMRETMSEDIQH